MGQKTASNLIWILFISIGLIFLVSGIFIVKNAFDYSDCIDTTGTIVDFERNNPVVEYTANGKTYQSRLNVTSSSYKIGNKIDIYYKKSNNYEIGSKSLNYLWLLFPGLGLIFTILGIVLRLTLFKGDGYKKKLIENGNLVYAEYIETNINTSFTLNGKSPYNIICKAMINNEEVELHSENIWYDPIDIIEQKNITKFPVYVDINNPKKYYMDISSLN